MVGMPTGGQMDSISIQLKNLSDTEKLGRFLGETANPGEIICLDGDLGAGKTTLSQAIARGLAVPENCYVTSPSFAILHEYAGRIPMYHMDFYRLQDANDVFDLGFEEYFYLSGLTVIEWSTRASEILPEDRISLEISQDDDEVRTVTIHATNIFQERLLQILADFQPAAGATLGNVKDL